MKDKVVSVSRDEKRKRKCLSCGRVFVSKGPWNRLCKSCRKKVAETSSTDFVVHPVHAGRT